MDSDSLIPSNELKPADVEERFYEAWHRVIPRHVYWTSKVMASMTDRQYNLLRAAYWCGSFVTLAFILDRYLENLLDSSANATGLVIFHTYVLFLCVFTMALCPFCFRFLKEVFLSKDIPQLVQMIYKRDRWLKLKFIFFDVFNMIGICISVLIYIIYWDEAMYYKLCLLVYMAVFLWPYCAAYALMLCLLEVHRVYAVQFIADLKNEVCKSEQSSEMDDTENAIGLRSRESNWHG